MLHRRVADRWLASQAQKQAGLLQPPPAMVAAIGEWVQAVTAANRKVQLDVDMERAEAEFKARPARYAPLLEAIADMRKELPAGTSKSLYAAATKLFEASFQYYGYGGFPQYKMGVFQKLTDQSRKDLAQRLNTQLDELEGNTTERINAPYGQQSVAKEMAQIRPYLRPGVGPITDSVRHSFPIDLTGWKYNQDKDLRTGAAKWEAARSKIIVQMDERLPKQIENGRVFDDETRRDFDFLRTVYNNALKGIPQWQTLKVLLTLKSEVPGARGWWSGADKELAIVIPSTARPYDIEESLMAVLRHELQHFGQTYLQLALLGHDHDRSYTTRDRKPVPGMPSRHIMTPKYHQEDKRVDGPRDRPSALTRMEDLPPNAHQTHNLDDTEFYTDLTDLLHTVHKELRKFNAKIQEYYKQAATPHERKQFLMEIFGLLKPKHPSWDTSVLHVQRVMGTWKKFAPGKWKKAMKEAFRAFPILAQRVEKTMERLAARKLNNILLATNSAGDDFMDDSGYEVTVAIEMAPATGELFLISKPKVGPSSRWVGPKPTAGTVPMGTIDAPDYGLLARTLRVLSPKGAKGRKFQPYWKTPMGGISPIEKLLAYEASKLQAARVARRWLAQG